MKPSRYLTVRDIVPPDFLKSPRSVVVEAGNGQGKTHAAVEYAVSLQKVGLFDRIYILEHSQKSAENAVNKVLRMGGWAIHHVGLEKFCPFYKEMREHINAGIPANLFCYRCSLFSGKSRLAFVEVARELERPHGKAVKPLIVQAGEGGKYKVCTHPIMRSYILDPVHELDARISAPETPIVVVPGQLFLNHAVIGRWNEFGRRQKRERRTLLIIDEADALFYSALRTEVPVLEASREDYELLERFSPKYRRLPRLLDVYREALSVLERVYEQRGMPEPEDLERLKALLDKSEPLIRSFNRRRKEIAEYVISGNRKTSVFKVVQVLEELRHIETLDIVLRSIEKVGGSYVLYDYDYGIRLFFDTSYPWRHFWKIVLSATFPTDKIVESGFVSGRTKSVLQRVERRSRSYKNVYVGLVRIFGESGGAVNRNLEVGYSAGSIMKAVKKAVSKYREAFGRAPGGVCLWFGNSKQMRTFVSTLSRTGVKVKVGRSHAAFSFGGIPVFVSYCGSSIARGVDLNEYDISIVVGPLLRPPRPSGVLDTLDFARGVAEAVQSAMRIVRSPHPRVPKLVVIERTMATSFYSEFYPDWFKELVRNSMLRLEEPEQSDASFKPV